MTSDMTPASADADADPATVPVTDEAPDAQISDELRLLDVSEFEVDRPPLIDADGRVRLSFSRIDAYRNCPLKFRYAYLDRLPGRPGPHLSFGNSMHSALEAFYDRKLPDCPSEDDLLGFLYDAWDTSGFAELPRSEQVAFYRHGQEALRRYHRRVAPSYRLPAATEAWFELPFGDEAVVVGAIDRIDADADGDLHVIDYKTNRKLKDRRRVASSLQLGIYALACEHLYGRLPATVSLDFVVAGQQVCVDLSDIDLEAVRAAVYETAAAVREERYAPTPNPLCEWCDFRPMCPAWDGDATEALGPAVAEARRLRRTVVRDVRALRSLEATVDRLSSEVETEQAPVGDSEPAPPEPSGEPGIGSSRRVQGARDG